MENIFSYVKWRGDLTFNESTFNEVDNVIFSAIVYLDFNNISDKNITIEKLASSYNASTNNIFFKNSEKLLSLISKCERYKDIPIIKYKKINNKNLEEQFGAMTFILPNDTLYIAFSGTDDSLVGWKEDFNLSYMDVVSSQKEAKKYVEDVINSYNKNVYIGGHSKGGNLAMYSAIFCEEKYKSKILKIYNNDGPGLSEEVFDSEKFLNIKNKIITYLPKFSIVGYLFHNESQIKLIESYQLGILEHDLFSWKVSNNQLVFIEDIDDNFKSVVNSINKTISKIPKKERKKIINLIYDLLTIFKIDSLDDLLFNNINLPLVLKKYDIAFDNYELIFSILKKLFQIITKL